MKADRLPIVTASDQVFAPGLRALLASLQRHCPERRVFVLDCGLDVTERRTLAERHELVEFVPPLLTDDLPPPSVGSYATYARLWLGEILRGERRVIYLDADTVVLCDLDELDRLELGARQIVAACIEPYTPTFGSLNGVTDFEKLGFSPSEPYFNAGVLVVDVEKWLQAEVGPATRTYLLRGDLRINLFDQEALNVVLAGRWLELDPEWNVSRYWMKADRRQVRPNILIEARIVHFLSTEKPWSQPDKVHPWLLARFQENATPPTESACAKSDVKSEAEN